MSKIILFTIIAIFLIAGSSHAGPTIGIYGVPGLGSAAQSANPDTLTIAGVNAVFVPPDRETIFFYKTRGYQVFLSMNVFGGSSAWQTFPDSRPITASGEPLGEGYGGVCPTHRGWRSGRLDHIRSLVKDFAGKDLAEGGIDGIWLDFIRYPGKWEEEDPQIPDTCYCARCLAKFQKDKKITIPAGLETKAAAVWIRNNAPYKWLQWKKEQIASFVRAARNLTRNDGGKKLRLGVFLVPWTKGERSNAITSLLGQDPFLLAGIADVISPMVYHRLVGQKPAWVGEMTEYYRESPLAEVWPIIQAGIHGEDLSTNEFGKAVQEAAKAGADGLLVFSFKGMQDDFWPYLNKFTPPLNLIPNPGFSVAEQSNGQLVESSISESKSVGQNPQPATRNSQPLNLSILESLNPVSWSPGIPENKLAEKSILTVKRSVEYLGRFRRFDQDPDRLAIGIRAGNDRAGTWSAPLPECEPGAEYLFTAEMFRDDFENGVYPNLSFWGREFRINTFLMKEIFFPVRLNIVCDNGNWSNGQLIESLNREKIRAQGAGRKAQGKETIQPATRNPQPDAFVFTNPHPGTTFALRKPKLVKRSNGQLVQWSNGNPEPATSFYPDIFPIGAYGAGLEDLEQVKALGINTVIIGGSGEGLRKLIEKCHDLGLRYMISVPHDPDRLAIYLDRIDGMIRPGWASFYVNDEPGIHAYPVHAAQDVDRLLEERFPGVATAMAIVRPQVVQDYMDGADFFMLDQYPVPSQPMTWLSDSMDEAARAVGTSRLASVIQAFSEPEHGWPRLPTFEEINLLAFLSIIHNSRGVFFFSYRHIGKTAEGREDLGRVVQRLNRLYTWLQVENLPEPVQVEMVSSYRVDPQGRPAVHCAMKEKGDQRLILCANTISAPVEAEIRVDQPGMWQEVYSNQDFPVIQKNIRARFKAYEVKVFEGK